MRFFTFLFCFSCAVRAAEPGPLVIVGGGGTPLAVRQHFVKLAGGKAARIAVLPRASAREDRGVSSEKMFSELGAKVFIGEIRNPTAARALLDEATAIVVHRDKFTVRGKGSVIVIDARQAKISNSKSGELQSGSRLSLHILKAGQAFQFK